MRVVFAGTPEVAVPSLRRFLDSPDHEVVGVITRPDAVSGRGRRTVRSEVGVVADEAGLPVITPTSLRDPEAAATLRDWAPDLAAVVAYGGLVPPELLESPTHGWINLHFSLLPAWRGAAPVQAAIAAGDEVTGATTFRLEAGLDTGPVYGVITEQIRADDTSGQLLQRLSEVGADLLLATVDGVAAGELAPMPQPPDGVSSAPKVTVADARVRWDLPAHLVDRAIRAHTPAPGAWTVLGEDRFKLGPLQFEAAVPDQVPADLAPGRLAATAKAVFVGTADRPVRLGTVQPPGKRAVAAADWARGARLTGEEQFS